MLRAIWADVAARSLALAIVALVCLAVVMAAIGLG